MPSMKAMQVKCPGADFELVTLEIPEPGEKEVQIKVEACGICHGDVIPKQGHFPGIKYPIVPGHEVVGIIQKTGAGIKNWKVGQRVGVGWHAGHCLECADCIKGNFKACKKSQTTGLTIDGGYAEYAIIRNEVLVSIPEDLSSIEAAPLLCAGRTTFGALRDCKAKGGELVAIQGMGGLGHLAVQYAVRLGFKTAVLSRGKDKEEMSYKLGAHIYIDTETSNAAEELAKLGGAKVILCTAPNGQAISGLLPGLGYDGEIIIVAGTGDMIQVPAMQMLMEQRSIKGWTGGDPQETVDFSSLWDIKPMVEVFPLEKAQEAFDRMMSAKVRFRAVLKMGDE